MTIGQFEESIVRYAQDYGVDAVLCGHIHTASIRNIGGVEYLNTGDWVETCSAIVEHHDGKLELICWKPSPGGSSRSKAIPKQVSESSGRPSGAVLDLFQSRAQSILRSRAETA